MELVDFLVNYWQYIGAGLVILLNIVLLVFKRRPMSLDEFQSALDDLYRNLPYYICVAETKSSDLVSANRTKKEYVVARSIDHVSSKIGRPLTFQEQKKVEKGASYTIEET